MNQILILCDNTKCIWNETICYKEGISRNECKRSGLIRISKEGYCENREYKE